MASVNKQPFVLLAPKNKVLVPMTRADAKTLLDLMRQVRGLPKDVAEAKGEIVLSEPMVNRLIEQLQTSL